MRLLLVEDDPQLAELVQEGLTRQGFAIDRCGSLKEAMAARGAASYDLILLDLGLPDGDGMSLVRELRKSGRSSLFASASRMSRNWSSTLRSGEVNSA